MRIPLFVASVRFPALLALTVLLALAAPARAADTTLFPDLRVEDFP